MRTIIINVCDLLATAALAAVGLLLVDSTSAAEIHEYTVAIDADLKRLSVEAHFASPRHEISARSRYARQYLNEARNCDTDQKLRTRGRRLVTSGEDLRCLAYEVDLQNAARTERLNRRLDSANIAVSPTLWLWRPGLSDSDEIQVRFELPDNVRVSVPWQSVSGIRNTYRLTTSPESGSAIAVFGDFDSHIVSVAGADLNVTLLRSHTDIDIDEIADWVRETALNITLAYGRFPNPAARVVVIPVGGSRWSGDSPVPFGRVVRDGGETIELLINELRPVSEFYDEWEPTHELSHLMLPYLRHSQRWISEGFATYYQNMLLARAGRYSDDEAWSKLCAGFERGRESVPELSPNDAAAGGDRNTRMKVYWSGASLALMADVELRRRSNGAESLDTVLDEFQQCCLPSARSWSGPELFRKFDSLIDQPLFMDLYRQYADTDGFPDVRPLLLELGVIIDDGKVRFSDEAELAALRSILTAPLQHTP